MEQRPEEAEAVSAPVNKHKIDYLLEDHYQPSKVHKSTSFSSIAASDDFSSDEDYDNDDTDNDSDKEGGEGENKSTLGKSPSLLELSALLAEDAPESPRPPTTPTQMLPSLFESLQLPHSPTTRRKMSGHHHSNNIDPFRSITLNNMRQNHSDNNGFLYDAPTFLDPRSIPPYVTLSRYTANPNQQQPKPLRPNQPDVMVADILKSGSTTNPSDNSKNHNNTVNPHHHPLHSHQPPFIQNQQHVTHDPMNTSDGRSSNVQTSDLLRHYSIPQSPSDNRDSVLERIQTGQAQMSLNPQAYAPRHSDPGYLVYAPTKPNYGNASFLRHVPHDQAHHLHSHQPGYLQPSYNPYQQNAVSSSHSSMNGPSMRPAAASNNPHRPHHTSTLLPATSRSHATSGSSLLSSQPKLYLAPPELVSDIKINLTPHNGHFTSIDEYVIYYMAQIRAQTYCTVLPLADSLKKEDKKIMCPFGGGCEKKIKGKGNLRRHMEWHLRKTEDLLRRKQVAQLKHVMLHDDKSRQKWTLKKRESPQQQHVAMDANGSSTNTGGVPSVGHSHSHNQSSSHNTSGRVSPPNFASSILSSFSLSPPSTTGKKGH